MLIQIIFHKNAPEFPISVAETGGRGSEKEEENTMKKMVLGILTALAVGALAGCSGGNTAETTTAAATEAVSQEAADDSAETTEAADDSAGTTEAAEVSADNPFNGKTVKVCCFATFVPLKCIEILAS